MQEPIYIVRTGTANTASVIAAFERLGLEPQVTERAANIAEARCVVLPGVGAFGAAARQLQDLELVDVLRERIEAGRPTLAICLGMQLFGLASDEDDEARGMGVLPRKIRAFPEGTLVPHLGWNEVTPVESELIEPGFAYFANSFCLDAIPAGWSGALTDYGIEFASAIERGAVLACQFHPELSGAWGAGLIERWLQRAEEA